MSALGRIHLALDQQFAIGALAWECQADLLSTVALSPELSAWVARSTGPTYERLEGAIKVLPLCPLPEVRTRLFTLWAELNDLHGLLLLSLLDQAGHWARTGEAMLVNHKLPREDLTAIAQIGALRGVRRWDPHRRIQLGTYARRWIRKAVLAEVDELFRVARHERAPTTPDGKPDAEHADPSQTEDALNEQREHETQTARLRAALGKLRELDPAAAEAVAIRYGLAANTDPAQRNNGAAATRGLEWLRRHMGRTRP